MNDEIKEILDYISDRVIEKEKWNKVKDYITNLQQENERLKQNQVKALNRIRDFINSSKCEIMEGSYSNDKHSQYWSLFKRFAEELQDKIKGLDTKDCVYIPKWREQELLKQEEQLEDYKSCCEKAIEYIKSYNLPKDLGHLGEAPISIRELRDLLNILQNGSEE